MIIEKCSGRAVREFTEDGPLLRVSETNVVIQSPSNVVHPTAQSNIVKLVCVCYLVIKLTVNSEKNWSYGISKCRAVALRQMQQEIVKLLRLLLLQSLEDRMFLQYSFLY